MPGKSKSFLKPKSTDRKRNLQVDRLAVNQRFLIVCEGEKTEPNYFRKFRAPGQVIKIEHVNQNTIRLVEEAIRLRDRDGDFDQTWCVFDKDDFSADDFNYAIHHAQANGVQVAYSNQAFELWYVLHFALMQNAISRQDYIRFLEKQLKHPYTKNSKTIFDELLQHLPEALRNAKKILALYEPGNPARNDPSTSVHLLVEKLKPFTLPFSTRGPKDQG
jgi:hypothetical protein